MDRVTPPLPGGLRTAAPLRSTLRRVRHPRRVATSSVLLIAFIGIPVFAANGKPRLEPAPTEARVPCQLSYASIYWHFPSHHQGFTTDVCDDGGGAAWEYGTPAGIPDAPGRVWGTSLTGNYPNDAGHRLRSPTFHVDEAHRFMELHHYFDIEYGYDGGNVLVWPDNAILDPVGGYTLPVISVDPTDHAWCVDGEPGWTGSSGGWRVDCFDLWDYIGTDVALEFDFGSDADVTAAGWYLELIIVGGVYDEAVCCNPSTGQCTITSQGDCLASGGEWHPELTSCDPNPCGPPSPPANLVALTQGPDRIRLEWEYEPGGAEEFVIERKDGPGEPWETVHVASGDLTAWEDTGVSMGPTYYYRVRAGGTAGDSELSNFASGSCGVVPAAPSDFVTFPVAGALAMRLEWTDHATNEMGFVVERKDGEFGTWQPLFPSPSYPVAPPTDATLYTDQSVDWETSYVYRIAAYNAYGRSTWAESPLTWMTIDPGAFSSTVVVRRGTQTIEGAELMVRPGASGTWQSAGFTDANGSLVVSGLHVGYFLRAATMKQILWDCREYNEGGGGSLGVYLWRDSDWRDVQAIYHPVKVEGEEVSYTLELDHPVFRFDLTFSTEFDIPTPPQWGTDYWDSLTVGCQRASDYLFDVTDGQAALRKVVLMDNKTWWSDAHVQVHNYRSTASARTDNYYDCDSWSPEEHIHVDSSKPEDADWWTTLIHEIGHYVFDFKDEYQNGFGAIVMGYMNEYYPDLHPRNHGVMQWETTEAEFSSRNDYPPNYDYGCGGVWWCEKWFETEQLYERGQSCWDQLESKLEGLTYDVDIVKPDQGWYVNGAPTSSDRAGPVREDFTMEVYQQDAGNRIAPLIEVEIIDSGPGSYMSDLVIEAGNGPAGGADVYRLSNDQWTYLGRTNWRGQLAARGLQPGDDIRVFYRERDGVRSSTRTLSGSVPRSVTVQVSPAARAAESSSPGRDGSASARGQESSASSREQDSSAPGATVSILPVGEAPGALVQLRFRADEPLGRLPEVSVYHGGGGGPLVVTQMPAGFFVAEAEVDISDSAFDGSGLFEVTLEDTLLNSTTFIAPFQIDETRAAEHVDVYQEAAEFNISSSDITSDQLYATISSNAVPYRTPEPPGVPVTDMFSIGLRDDDTWPSFGSVSIAYDDSLLRGLDETSLVMGRFDRAIEEWVVVDSSRVIPEANQVTGLVSERGVFCVFAGASSVDETLPGRVDDLGSVPVDGVGEVELLWTAPGDDGPGSEEPVQEYIVGYASEPFSEDDWHTVRKIRVGISPGVPGSDQWSIIRLPVPRNLYYLGLRSKDEASNLSPLSNITYVVAGMADPNLVPAPPTDLHAVDQPDDEGGAVRLGWQRSYDDGGGKGSVVAYVLYRSNPPSVLPESLAVVPDGTTTYVDATVQNDSIYLYWVAASDGTVETMTGENRALSAWNTGMPLADFTSDGKVGINDLGHLADTYGILATDPEFDPLFDLDADGQIWAGDAAILEELFFQGGLPVTDPVGQNDEAMVFVRYVADEGDLWHLDLSVTDVSNLAGFQAGVEYPSAEATFIGATGEVVQGESPLLNRNGGATPIFVVQDSDPDRVRVATAIQDASEGLAPEGAGYLCRLSFWGPGMEATSVLAVSLMDHEKRINTHTEILLATLHAATVLRPHLYRSYPNPCRTSAAISFEIPDRTRVTLRIFDLTGRLVRTLIDGVYDAGVHGALWDGQTDSGVDVSSGMYFYRMKADAYTSARKLLVLR